MKTIILHNKNRIESFLRKKVFSNIYCIGDLDDLFWENTIWYGLEDKEELKAIILIYTKFEVPVLLTSATEESLYNAQLLESITALLPKKFYAHLDEGMEDILLRQYNSEYFGKYLKMALEDPAKIQKIDTFGVQPLVEKDAVQIKDLYDVSYKENWFDESTLATGKFFGLRNNQLIVSVAGVHVYSEKYKVAAIGNITTHPEYRNKGFGTKVTGELCNSLLDRVNHIGLNVKADNLGAINCYKKLGFKIIDSYEEYMFELK